ncbi:MAG: SH3 domain-containing protein [Chloroflexota bacterium]
MPAKFSEPQIQFKLSSSSQADAKNRTPTYHRIPSVGTAFWLSACETPNRDLLKLLRSWILILVLSGTLILQAQSPLVSTITVIGEAITFQRANTTQEYSLSVNAIAPFGIGDTVRTGSNGRILIELSADASILLLPDSTFTIDDFRLDEDGITQFSGELQGIALHQLEQEELTYQLTAGDVSLTVSAPANFGAWNSDTNFDTITVETGEVTVTDGETDYTLLARDGISPQLDQDIIALDDLLHPVQISRQTALCDGVVSTNGGLGLRLRAGAALDYSVANILQDGDPVQIIGTTDNGLWYRIPSVTSYGWIFSNLIEATCEDLPTFEDLYRETPARINNVTELELDFLLPYYGSPEDNIGFYR